MAKISKDVPRFIIEMLDAVDYSKIADAHYNDWIETIKFNIGKHLRLKSKPPSLMLLNYPIRQDFCDLINKQEKKSVKKKDLTRIMN